LVVKGGLFALSPSVSSFTVLVLDSLDGVFEGGLSELDLVLNTGEFNLGVGKGSLGDADGDAEELAGLVVGDDAGVFSGSLEVKGVLDLSEELIDEVDDSAKSTLVGKLLGLGGDGGEDLEDLGVGLAVDDLEAFLMEAVRCFWMRTVAWGLSLALGFTFPR